MNFAAVFEVAPLTLADLAAVERYWRRAHPLHPLSGVLLRERLFTLPGADPELMLAARQPDGEIVGLATGVFPCREPESGGVRWIGVDPALAGRELLGRLLDEICGRLVARGAKNIRLFATPPYYLRPGVDIREVGLLSDLLALGWTQEKVNFNMTADLTTWHVPPEAIYGPDAAGRTVRRARPEERESVVEFVAAHWTAGWRDEARVAFGHDPVTCFLAEQAGQVVGFAAYNVNQCEGSFGPTGVVEDQRGGGLGRRLLWACLDDLKRSGRPVCEIGWIGPIGFYNRACGATLGPVYWSLIKSVDVTS